jgi:hypothetical protein
MEEKTPGTGQTGLDEDKRWPYGRRGEVWRFQSRREKWTWSFSQQEASGSSLNAWPSWEK